MSGASLIPVDAPGDHEDVADLLSIARVTWNRGDREAAVNFVQRAAQTAMEIEIERGIELAKLAAELKASVSHPPAPVRMAGAGPVQSPPRPMHTPSAGARAFPSATATPQLVLTPSQPHAQTLQGLDEVDVDRVPLQPPAPEMMEDIPATVPQASRRPTERPVVMLSNDALVEEVPQRDTSIDPPPGHAASLVKGGGRSGSPRPPTVTSSQAPRPGGPSTGPSSVHSPAPASQTRASVQAPPLPSHRPGAGALHPSKPPAEPTGAGPTSTSPVPPKVTNSKPAGPASIASSAIVSTASPSRAPLPLRVKTGDDARVFETPAPPMVSGAADPSTVRRSSPWIDDVVAPIAGRGGAPVVIGLRARIHFHTDGSLELGPDAEGATGLPVIVLPQRGEDMSTLLKRLAARKR